MKNVFQYAATLGLLSLLAGCAGPLHIDSSKSAKSQESRVQFLILHYTALDLPTSLKVLTTQGVSSHYLLGDDAKASLYRLVDETQTAHHAGLSDWKGRTYLNPSSIGIEIVNLGYIDTPAGREYPAFPQSQIDKLILLVKDISTRHKIKPENILGHNEIAPQRKSDPGPKFPWKQLADAGLIPWPDAQQVALKQSEFEPQLPDITWFQQRLLQHGYATPQTGLLDDATRNVLKTFQTRYRPEKFDGMPDASTAALLDVMTRKLR
jgi:N-acetylmuramoyl-L-alanine amidase